MEAHTQREEAPAGRPTLVRLKDGGLALVKTIGGKRMIVRRYGSQEEAEAQAQHGFGLYGNGHGSSRLPLPGGSGLPGIATTAAGQYQEGAPVVEIIPDVQRLPLAPLTQEAAERMNERAVGSFSRGLDALSGVLNVIQERLGRTETVSEAQIEVLKQISASLNQANERSEAVVAQLQSLPSILQSLQTSIDRQTSGLERRDQTLIEFRNTMADINQAIHELSSRQLNAMDRMGEKHSEALQTLTQDHAGTMERIVGQQVEAWRSMTVDQKDLVEKVTATNAEMLSELQKSQVDALEEVNARQTQAFERNQQRSLDLFSQAQTENIGVFARVQAEQARNMTEVLARSQNAYKYLIVTMMMLVLALVLILVLKI